MGFVWKMSIYVLISVVLSLWILLLEVKQKYTSTDWPSLLAVTARYIKSNKVAANTFYNCAWVWVLWQAQSSEIDVVEYWRYASWRQGWFTACISGIIDMPLCCWCRGGIKESKYVALISRFLRYNCLSLWVCRSEGLVDRASIVEEVCGQGIIPWRGIGGARDGGLRIWYADASWSIETPSGGLTGCVA